MSNLSHVLIFGQKRCAFGAIKCEFRHHSSMDPIDWSHDGDGYLGRSCLNRYETGTANVIGAAIGQQSRPNLRLAAVAVVA
ncbi:hypothetical protein Q3C01_13885 [Bradyrhizobium sp. UFLA05-109]